LINREEFSPTLPDNAEISRRSIALVNSRKSETLASYFHATLIPDRRGGVMYAALVHLTIDPESAPAAAKAFSENILPNVQSASGFVCGYWVDPIDSQGFGFLLFESEKQGIAATPPRADWSAPGVTITRTDVRRVAVAIP
jgi:hypothetical protein